MLCSFETRFQGSGELFVFKTLNTNPKALGLCHWAVPMQEMQLSVSPEPQSRNVGHDCSVNS